ncbi:hypothetical protein PIROE2DRAFT_6065 [Piromyces sp. E2]|nr:hypothetical protein PIROE2DRAFT_6065 [Piromyces sp. E2]|eukprot:OUM66647.1 hypothetical protein PIROE2DRAFT_6065 [Piromyces sp. E2]
MNNEKRIRKRITLWVNPIPKFKLNPIPKFKFNRKRKTFISSDPHFYHSNIIKYCNRPYHVSGGNRNPANIPEVNRMNEDILKVFDSLPDDCDIWIHTDYNSEETIQRMESLVSRIRHGGRRNLFLLIGNHDNGIFEGSTTKYYLARGFDAVYRNPVIVDEKYILSHEPVFLSKGSPFINVYGHLHEMLLQEDYFCSCISHRLPKNPSERLVDLENYQSVCIDYVQGVLEWEGDKFLPRGIEILGYGHCWLCWPYWDFSIDALGRIAFKPNLSISIEMILWVIPQEIKYFIEHITSIMHININYITINITTIGSKI